MRVKYIRVSSLDQNTERQKSDLPEYIDKCSGSIPFSERESAKDLLTDIEKGIITEVEVHSIDRLGRNTLDIMQTIESLTDKGINVISTKEGLSTIVDGKVNPIAKMMIGILGTLSEFELNRSKERQLEGIAKAKAKGVYVGRAKGSKESLEQFLNKASVQRIIKHLDNGESLRRTALLSKTSLSLVQKVVKVRGSDIKMNWVCGGNEIITPISTPQ